MRDYSQYMEIYQWMWFVLGLKGKDLMVFCYIYNHTCPTPKEIGEFLGMPPVKVWESIRFLQAQGFIQEWMDGNLQRFEVSTEALM